MISVIIPVYNGEKTIQKAIQSVINQSYGNIELVIVNDGSTDNTENICNNIMSDAKIQYKYVRINNSGLANARNVGWNMATGDYCCNLDADDYLESSIFKEIFESCSEFDVCYYGYRDVKSDGSVLFSYEQRFVYERMLSGIEAAKKKLLRKIWICQGSALYKRSLFFDCEIKNIPGINQGEDLLFITSALANSKKIECIDKIGVNILVSNSSMMHAKYNETFVQSILAAEELYKRLEKLSPDTDILAISRGEILNQISRVSKVLIKSSGFSFSEIMKRIKLLKKGHFRNVKALKKFYNRKKYIELNLLKKFTLLYFLLVKLFY